MEKVSIYETWYWIVDAEDHPDRTPLQARNTVPPKSIPSVPNNKPTIPTKSIQASNELSASTELQPSKELNPKPLLAKGVEGETQADDDTVYFVQQSDGKTIAKTAHGQGVPLTHNIRVRKVNRNETVVVKDKEGNVIFVSSCFLFEEFWMMD
jgi:hypothetical protein